MISPACSSMSISRLAGCPDNSFDREINSSVVFPIAETTTTTAFPLRFSTTTRFATRLM